MPEISKEERVQAREILKHKWERIGVIASIVAVLLTFGFSVWDKWDYKKQIAVTTYDKLYSDASKGHLNSTKLVDAINRIIEKKDDLSGMNLEGKWLPNLELPEKTNMYRINLSKANLKAAHLKKTNLRFANLVEAKLGGANLGHADLRKANLVEAYLTGANLAYADLRSANLTKANLVEAYLTEANLAYADLTGANLEYAIDLTIEQLSTVATLNWAKLDPELMAQVKEKYPHLLEEPKREEEKTEVVQEE